jgi:hypothetical protein
VCGDWGGISRGPNSGIQGVGSLSSCHSCSHAPHPETDLREFSTHVFPGKGKSWSSRLGTVLGALLLPTCPRPPNLIVALDETSKLSGITERDPLQGARTLVNLSSLPVPSGLNLLCPCLGQGDPSSGL